jgi:hypothetical protein
MSGQFLYRSGTEQNHMETEPAGLSTIRFFLCLIDKEKRMSKFNVPSNEEQREALESERSAFRKYDPEPQRDYMRAGIASGLLVLLIGMVTSGSIQLVAIMTKQESCWKSCFRRSSVFWAPLSAFTLAAKTAKLDCQACLRRETGLPFTRA